MIGLERWSNYYRDRIDFESGILQAENSLIFQKSIASFSQDIEQAQGIIKRRKNILKLSRSLYKFDHRPPPFSPSGIIDSPRFQLVQRVSVDPLPLLVNELLFVFVPPSRGTQETMSSIFRPWSTSGASWRNYRHWYSATPHERIHTRGISTYSSYLSSPATLSSKCREMVAPTNGYLLSGSEFF